MGNGNAESSSKLNLRFSTCNREPGKLKGPPAIRPQPSGNGKAGHTHFFVFCVFNYYLLLLFFSTFALWPFCQGFWPCRASTGLWDQAVYPPLLRHNPLFLMGGKCLWEALFGCITGSWLPFQPQPCASASTPSRRKKNAEKRKRRPRGQRRADPPATRSRSSRCLKATGARCARCAMGQKPNRSPVNINQSPLTECKHAKGKRQRNTWRHHTVCQSSLGGVRGQHASTAHARMLGARQHLADGFTPGGSRNVQQAAGLQHH